MSLADMTLRSHREAAQIYDTLEFVKPAVFDTVNTVGVVLNTLEATERLGGDVRQDVVEAIDAARESYTDWVENGEQLLSKIDGILRATQESSGLLRDTREKLGAAAGHLAESGEVAADHLNRASNIATLTTGLTYLYSDIDYLRKTLHIARPEVIKELLTDMGWKVEEPANE